MDGRSVISVVMAVLLLPVWEPVEAGHILVLAMPAWSHIKPKLNVAAQLAKLYGHHSTFVLNKSMAKKVQTNNKTSVIVPPEYGNLDLEQFAKSAINDVCYNVLPVPFFTLRNIIRNSCDILLSDEALYKTLKDQHFDLALVDNVLIGDCFTVLAYKLGLPYVQMGNSYTPVRTRIPMNPSVHPAISLLGFTDEMTFMQRLVNTIFSVAMAVAPQVILPSDLVQAYAPDKPPVSLAVLHRKTAFHLIDADYILDFPKPMMPNVVFVGGLATEKPKLLPENIKAFMDSAKDGAIITSFGSVAENLPTPIMERIIQIFKQFKNIKFVMRYGNETKMDENVFLMKWIPQNDLVGHPNTKAVITHCGSSSTYEALYSAVPIIGLPFFSDGFYNCRKVARRGYGITFDLCKFTDEELSGAIREILNNPKYKEKMNSGSKIFHNLQGTPSERSAFWIDHIIQHGGEYLQTPATDMADYQYYLVDVFLFIVSVFVIFSLCCVKATRACCRCCCKSKIKAD